MGMYDGERWPKQQKSPSNHAERFLSGIGPHHSLMEKSPRADAIQRPLAGDLEQPPPLLSPPRRQSNLDWRTREYLTPAEVEKLLQASEPCKSHEQLIAHARPQ